MSIGVILKYKLTSLRKNIGLFDKFKKLFIEIFGRRNDKMHGPPPRIGLRLRGHPFASERIGKAQSDYKIRPGQRGLFFDAQKRNACVDMAAEKSDLCLLHANIGLRKARKQFLCKKLVERERCGLFFKKSNNIGFIGGHGFLSWVSNGCGAYRLKRQCFFVERFVHRKIFLICPLNRYIEGKGDFSAYFGLVCKVVCLAKLSIHLFLQCFLYYTTGGLGHASRIV